MADSIAVLKDGRKLGYAEYGVPSGLPVLFFHGTPGARIHPVCATIDAIAKAELSGPSLRLIAVDRPGYGLSDVHPNRSIEDWADDVAELADKLEINDFSVWAVSGGAPYAYACSAKLSHRVNKIAVVCGLGPVYQPDFLDSMPPEEKQTFQAALYAPEHLKAFTEKIQKNPSAFVESVLSGMSETERNAISPELIQGYTQLMKEGTKNPDGMISDYKIFSKDWGVGFASLSVPVHFWHSSSDQNVPVSHSEYIAAQLPKATFTRVDGLNHYTTVLVTAKDVINYLVN